MITIEQFKKCLDNENILYKSQEYDNLEEFYDHLYMFPVYNKKERIGKVKALIIKNDNNNKDIELIFCEDNKDFFFNDMFFGEYSFEFFDWDVNYEEIDDLLLEIKNIMENNVSVIIINNISKKRYVGDFCFDGTNKDKYQRIINSINKPKSIIKKIFSKSILQYDIYNWNDYYVIKK